MQKTEIIYSNFHKFSAHLAQLGESGVGNSIFTLGTESRYQLQYIPFEHIRGGPAQLDRNLVFLSEFSAG